MTEKELKEIREKISCPQFNDNHYGAWGALNLEQRKTILRLLDYIQELKKETVYEFATRLKMKEKTAIHFNRFEGVISTDEIDNIIKEMRVNL